MRLIALALLIIVSGCASPQKREAHIDIKGQVSGDNRDPNIFRYNVEACLNVPL